MVLNQKKKPTYLLVCLWGVAQREPGITRGTATNTTVVIMGDPHPLWAGTPIQAGIPPHSYRQALMHIMREAFTLSVCHLFHCCALVNTGPLLDTCLCHVLLDTCFCHVLLGTCFCHVLLGTCFAGNFAQLCELISKSSEQLAKNAGHLDNALGTFDMQQHSLGVLGILYVHNRTHPHCTGDTVR